MFGKYLISLGELGVFFGGGLPRIATQRGSYRDSAWVVSRLSVGRIATHLLLFGSCFCFFVRLRAWLSVTASPRSTVTRSDFGSIFQEAIAPQSLRLMRWLGDFPCSTGEPLALPLLPALAVASPSGGSFLLERD